MVNEEVLFKSIFSYFKLPLAAFVITRISKGKARVLL